MSLTKICMILIVLLISGCAGNGAITHDINFESDFGSMIDTVINYTTDNRSTVVEITINNNQKLDIQVWLVQKYTFKDSETIRRKLVIEGNQEIYNRVFRVAVLDESMYDIDGDVEDEISFEFFTKDGEVLFMTKPIIDGYMENHQYNHSIMGVW